MLSSGLVYGSEPVKIKLTSSLVGENTADTVSLVATARALDASILAENLAEAKNQLACLNALIGAENDVVCKSGQQVAKGWIYNTTNKVEYVVNGRNVFQNSAELEAVLMTLGFGKYQDIVNTDFTAKAAYLKSYLDVMNGFLKDANISLLMVQAFHNEFKSNFGQLTAAGSTKTVDQLKTEAQAVAVQAVSNVVLPEVVEGWFGFGTKSKVGLGMAVVLIGLAAGKRTI